MSETSEFEAATEFLLRKRGRVSARWILIPVVLCWIGAVSVTAAIGSHHRPELLDEQIGLYLCAGFFVHAYGVAWRSGVFIWRYSALMVATFFYAVLCFLHGDDAGAWLIYTQEGVTARPPQPGLFVPVTLNVLSVLALWVHGLFLGLGSRDPDAPSPDAETAPPASESPDAETAPPASESPDAETAPPAPESPDADAGVGDADDRTADAAPTPSPGPASDL